MKSVRTQLALFFSTVLICLAIPQAEAASYTIPLGDPFASISWRTYWAGIILPTGVPEDGDQVVVVDPANGDRIVGGWTVVASQIGSASSLSWNSLASSPGFTPGNTYTFFYWDQSTDTNYENCTIAVQSFAGSYDGTTFPISDGQLSAFNITFTSPTVTLSSSPASIAEAAGASTITATLSTILAVDVTVDLAYTGTATGSGTDYTASASSIVISAGNTTGTATVTADQDTIYEGDETIIVDISSVTNAVESGTQQETITITDDDAQPTVTLSADTGSIVENAGASIVTATLSAPAGLPVTVNLALTGTATGSGTDYTASTTSIVIPAAATSADATITAVQDLIFEGDEDVVVDIDTVTNGTEDGVQTQTITITDDDAEPTVTLAASTATIAEAAGASTITATLSNPTTQVVTVNLAYTGTATGGGTDYSANTASIVIGAGSTTGTAIITAVQDTIFEGNETVIVNIDSIANATESGTQTETITITDDDSQPTVTLSVDTATIAEAAGVATLTATLSNESTQNVTVNFGFTGTATGGSVDYDASAPSVVITAGSTTGTITLTAAQDTIAEGNETVITDITSVTNGTENGVQQETVTIVDDEPTPSVTLTVDTATIGEAPEVSTITATLDIESAQTITVNLAYTGTALGGGVDYTASTAAIVIGAGSFTGTATITSVQDVIYEGNETVIVDIDSVVNANENGTQQETVTITDDESAPLVTLTVDTANIAENGGVAVFTATLSVESATAVTVDLGITGTATGAGTDYTASGTQIVIPAGSTSGTMVVTAVDDVIFEGDETVVVDITAVTGGFEDGVQSEQTTITDDDSVPSVTLTASSGGIAESLGTSIVTATLTGLSATNVTVNLGFTGTATGGGTDYTASGTVITITAGTLSSAISVTAVQDTIIETNETIIIDITSVTNANESGTQQETIIIADDDRPDITLTSDVTRIKEAAGVATLTATASFAPTQDVTVNLGFTGDAVGGGVDYTVSAASITITAGTTTGTATITAVDDVLKETREEVIVDITTLVNGLEASPQQVTVQITDNDTKKSSGGSSGCNVGHNQLYSILPIILVMLLVGARRRRRSNTAE